VRNLEALSSDVLVAQMNSASREAAAVARRPRALHPRGLFTQAGLHASHHRLGLATQQDGAASAATRLAPLARGAPQPGTTLPHPIARRFPAFVFGNTNVGSFYLAAGDPAAALQWFRRAYDNRDIALFAISYRPTTPPAFLASAGWISLNQKPEAIAWHAAHE